MRSTLANFSIDSIDIHRFLLDQTAISSASPSGTDEIYGVNKNDVENNQITRLKKVKSVQQV